MFVFSFKASTVKIISALLACFALVSLAIFLMPDTGSYVNANKIVNSTVSLDKISSEKDIVKFLSSLGFTVEESAISHGKVSVPKRFDAVLEKYNGLQQMQGFDLTKYKGKNVNRYTFRVTSFPDGTKIGDEEYLATVVLYKQKVVAGDVCCVEKKEYFPIISNAI